MEPKIEVERGIERKNIAEYEGHCVCGSLKASEKIQGSSQGFPARELSPACLFCSSLIACSVVVMGDEQVANSKTHALPHLLIHSLID